MNHRELLNAFNAAGAALASTGEQRITLTYDAVSQQFTVGVRAEPNGLSADTFAHDADPTAALVKALAAKSDKAREMEIRARIAAQIEAAVRSEFQQEAA